MKFQNMKFLYLMTVTTVAAAMAGQPLLYADTPPSPEEQAQNEVDKQNAAQTEGKQQTTINADETEIDFRGGMAVFTGNVMVKSQSLELQARKMTVHFDNQQNLTRIVAEEDVVIKQPDAKRTAVAGKAVYNVIDGTITLTDNPRLDMEDGVLENAESITYYRDSERVMSRGGTISFPTGADGDDGLDIFKIGGSENAE